VGNPSKYRVDANFTVLRQVSALVPPITNAMWYGGQAAVPNDRIFSARNGTKLLGFNNAFVS
jgi:hypothetical protein